MKVRTIFVFQVWHSPARRFCDKWSRDSAQRIRSEVKAMVDAGKVKVRWRIVKREIREQVVLAST